MSNSKGHVSARKLEIIKVNARDGETINFSDSIMDFSPEELAVIIGMLQIFLNHSVAQRKELIEQYKQLPYKFTNL